MITPTVTVTSGDESVIVVTMDDGRANALDEHTLKQVRAALADARRHSRPLVLAGRTSVFSAGLDKATMTSDGIDHSSLLVTFAATLLDLLTYPGPVVIAATGHAIAAGVILTTVGDCVVAAFGEARWGLTETRVALAQRGFGVALARHRMGASADRWLLDGEQRSVHDAARDGLIDELVATDHVLDRARQRAISLGQIDAEAFRATKDLLNRDLVVLLEETCSLTPRPDQSVTNRRGTR